MTKNKILISLLTKKGLTIGSVESLTAGLFISTLANIPGASKVIRGGIITYQSSFKTSMLGISKDDIDKYGVVSTQIATLMAKKGFKKLKTDFVVSFTGNAGPSKEKGDASVGEVYIGIYSKLKDDVKVIHKKYTGSRNVIRKSAVESAFDEIIKIISFNFS